MTAITRIRRRVPAFPPLLAAIHDPPAQLFVRGAADVALLAEDAVAVVGARACSSYGRSVARTLARELAAAAQREFETAYADAPENEHKAFVRWLVNYAVERDA